MVLFEKEEEKEGLTLWMDWDAILFHVQIFTLLTSMSFLCNINFFSSGRETRNYFAVHCCLVGRRGQISHDMMV